MVTNIHKASTDAEEAVREFKSFKQTQQGSEIEMWQELSFFKSASYSWQSSLGQFQCPNV